MSLNILLVEDDGVFAQGMAEELRGFDHTVTVAADGREALAAVDSQPFDAVVLDRMLPRIDGISVLERLRSGNMTLPVIMLSALGRSVEKVEGLEAGADDYVVKPIASVELNARLLALVRARGWTAGSADTIRAGDIVVSPTRFRAWRAGTAIDLGKLEFKLLNEFVANADTVLTRAMLVERVWGYDFAPTTNIVDVYVRHLRVKLTADGGEDPILTVRGVGYMLRG
ncbi:two-component system OmpR family response regulator [Sphingomonas sp. PP-CE-3G-477]|uniref:response regulator transcription factor n=1 Tax=Sphingomonas sp. PP-CE-3G-477 TaxID=2135660 RepID=UPI000D3838CB|nr:response regulator transcription factor [Sphingomonas sp. PP-CE-3G-477]PTQ63332.1 two-component system OmpR family response regulator [Sphingomonas sp. PP-CE-3G-477]